MNIFKNAETLVRAVLMKRPGTRGNDVELVFAVWEEQGLKLTEEQKNLARKCYSPETITRIRRDFHSKGLFLPEPEKQEQRLFAEVEYNKHYRD